MEVLDGRRLLSTSVRHGHEHNGPINPAEVNVWAPTKVAFIKLGKYLTTAKKGDATKLVQNFLVANSVKLGTTRAAVLTAEVTDRYFDEQSGLTHVYLRQTFNGLPVINSVGNGSVDGSGRLLSAAAGFIRPGAATRALLREVGDPTVSGEEAVGHVAEEMGIVLRKEVSVAPYLGKSIRLSAPGLQATPMKTNLVYVARGRAKVELAWRMVVELEDGSHW